MGISRNIQRGPEPARSNEYAASEMTNAVFGVCGVRRPLRRVTSLFIAFLLIVVWGMNFINR